MRNTNYIAPSKRIVRRRPAEPKPVVVRKLRARARVTNRPAELPNVDLRSIAARRFTDITSQVIIDQGGESRLSEAKLQQIRRFAGASAMAEDMEARFARGEQIDISEYTALISASCRLSSQIGLTRAMKQVPSLDDYLKAKVIDGEVIRSRTRPVRRSSRAIEYEPDDDDDTDY